MTFTLCKVRIINSALLSLNHAIARLGEKALGSGGKSEDQPFSVIMPLHHDVWCKQAQLVFVDMKHESIVVVYDSCQAIAEEIADKLGAETVSVQSLNIRQVENSQSLVLAVEFQADGPLSPHWQYACQMFRGATLRGKNVAVMVALGNSQDNGIYAEAFNSELRQNGAHIVGDQIYADASRWNLDNWVCAVSPNL